jgi:hypothetical protein
MQPLALVLLAVPVFAGGGFPLEVTVEDQICLDPDTVELHLAVTHGSYSQPIYRWDFDEDHVWDTAPDIDPTQTLIVADDSVVSVAVGARNADGQRAHDTMAIQTILCP